MEQSFVIHEKFTVLFKPLVVDSPLGYVAACITFALLSLTYEGIKCLRMNLMEHRTKTEGDKPLQMCSGLHALQTLLFLLEITISYLTMLAVMTYNVWIFVSVILGSALGFQLCKVFSNSHTKGSGAITNGKKWHLGESNGKPVYEIVEVKESSL